MTASPLPATSPRGAWIREVRRWLAAAGIGWLPGALLAVHLAGLIFFLNPDLPFRPGLLVELAVRLAALLGTLSAVVIVALARGRPSRAWRLLPWGLTLALTAAAVLDGAQAAYFAWYLAPAVNTRLIKTALWLSLGALVGFYTALLHSLQKRRYGWKSRLAFLFVSLLSVVAMVERREALPTVRPALPSPSAARAAPAEQRALIVGVDSATLDAILPLVGQGRLPFLARMLREGAYGRLSSLSPVRREPLWMTLATGTYPYKHGALANKALRLEFLTSEARLTLTPAGVGFYDWGPWLGSEERQTHFRHAALPLWDILSRLGTPAAQIGWPGSAPVSHEPVFSVADVFFDRGPREQATVWPEELAGRALLFRIDRREVLAPDPSPALSTEWQDAFAQDRWRTSLTRFLIDDHDELGALFVFLPGFRRPAARFFGGFSAAQFEADSSEDARRAAEMVASYLDQVDLQLSELWERFERPEVFALVSAYGVEGPGPWARLWSAASRERALRGRTGNAPDGIFILAGTGVRAGTLLTGTGIADVAPTLLYALGLPIARDLDGRVVTAAFSKEFLASHPVTFLPSYQGLPPGEKKPAGDPGAAEAP